MRAIFRSCMILVKLGVTICLNVLSNFYFSSKEWEDVSEKDKNALGQKNVNEGEFW